MRLVQIKANSLVPGMFVAELDRPWLETPFALQGFVVRNDDDVAFVAEHCDYVFIDQDYRGAPIYLPLAVGKERKGSSLRSTLRIRSDFDKAKVSFESATEVLDRAFASLRDGRRSDLRAVQEAVTPLIDGVFRNKDAVAALVRLRASGNYLYEHGIAMAVWGAILGRQIGLDRHQLLKLVTGCAMADVGMTKLPAALLEKPGPLTPDEMALVRRHPQLGVEIMREQSDIDIEVLSVIEAHHERWDGSGYPRGLKGPAIPLVARIAAIADAYDAMITARPWARPRSSFEATQELVDVKGALFQPALVEQFIQAVGLFPTGALVELNTGEVAIVVKQNPLRRLKPEIVVVLDAAKQRLPKLKLIDLALDGRTDELDGGRWIARELTPGTYGLDSQDFFL